MYAKNLGFQRTSDITECTYTVVKIARASDCSSIHHIAQLL